MTEKRDRFHELVQDIEVAMFTTRRADGFLVSRPMATQVLSDGADLWFVTSKDSPKLSEIANDPHVNLAYYKDRTREWISASGTARVTDDRAKIRELWRPDWRAWFGDEGGPNDGTADDPRIVLIAVDLRFAQYMQVKLSRVYTLSREKRTPRLIVITFFFSRSTAGVLIVVEGDRNSSE